MILIPQDPLYRRMKRAVAATAPEHISELDRIMAKYNGEPRLLDAFLDRFGSDNPWEAAQNARLRQTIFRTAEELKSEGQIHGVSESGHKLTDQINRSNFCSNPYL